MILLSRAADAAVLPEGLFDDDPRVVGPLAEAVGLHLLHGQRARPGGAPPCSRRRPSSPFDVGRRDPVDPLPEPVEARVVLEDAAHVKEVPAEIVPFRLVEGMSGIALFHRLLHHGAVAVVVQVEPVEGDDGKGLGQLVLAEKVEERGDELPPAQVPGPSHDDERKRLDPALGGRDVARLQVSAVYDQLSVIVYHAAGIMALSASRIELRKRPGLRELAIL